MRQEQGLHLRLFDGNLVRHAAGKIGARKIELMIPGSWLLSLSSSIKPEQAELGSSIRWCLFVASTEDYGCTSKSKFCMSPPRPYVVNAGLFLTTSESLGSEI